VFVVRVRAGFVFVMGEGAHGMIDDEVIDHVA